MESFTKLFLLILLSQLENADKAFGVAIICWSGMPKVM